MCVRAVLLAAMVASVRASRGSLPEDAKEVAYRALAYDLEVILQQHLNNWKFLTETRSTIDMGEVFDKKRFLNPKNVQNVSRKARDVKWPNLDSAPVQCDKIFCSEVKMNKTKNKRGKDEDTSGTQERNRTSFYREKTQSTPDHSRNGMADTDGTLEIRENEEEQAKERDERSLDGGKRKPRNIPVMYMPGKKTKRKCVAAGGILSGHNAFSFLSFVTGVLSLVLNVNNNINNNNDNNNLNDNNAISNNNVDANANTQNANQIVVFPPGRKRRSFSDWRILQLISQRPYNTREKDEVDSKQRATQCNKGLSHHHVTDAMTSGLRLLAASAIEDLANSLSESQEIVFDDSWRLLSREIQQVRAKGGSGALLASAVRAISRG